MHIRKILTLALAAAISGTICLTTEKVSAQAEFENRQSTAIGMVGVRGTSNDEIQRTSHSGIMDPIGLRPNQQIAIALNVSSNRANYPVGIAPLDGGEVFASENLHVASDGTVGFTFQGGNTPGLYRVVVTIGSEQYELQLYVVKPDVVESGCIPP